MSKTEQLCNNLREAHISNTPLLDLSDTYQEDPTSSAQQIIDCIFEHPNAVERISFGHLELNDDYGEKLAQIIKNSSVVRRVYIPENNFSESTLISIAKALSFNTSLQVLYIYSNPVTNYCDAFEAFIESLQLNPCRPSESYWYINSPVTNVLPLFTAAAQQLGHPSLQKLMLART